MHLNKQFYTYIYMYDHLRRNMLMKYFLTIKLIAALKVEIVATGYDTKRQVNNATAKVKSVILQGK